MWHHTTSHLGASLKLVLCIVVYQVGVPCTLDVVGMIASSDLVLGTAPSSSDLDVLRTAPSSSDLDVLGTATSSSDLDVVGTAPSSCHLVDVISYFSFCFAIMAK